MTVDMVVCLRVVKESSARMFGLGEYCRLLVVSSFWKDLCPPQDEEGFETVFALATRCFLPYPVLSEYVRANAKVGYCAPLQIDLPDEWLEYSLELAVSETFAYVRDPQRPAAEDFVHNWLLQVQAENHRYKDKLVAMIKFILENVIEVKFFSNSEEISMVIVVIVWWENHWAVLKAVDECIAGVTV